MEKPLLSVIVIVYNMPRQAMNTLLSLSDKYQKNVSINDYEIIVVENYSSNTLDIQEVNELGANIHYHLRSENGVSPVAAINFGISQAQGEYIGLIIDGARMVTPRVVEYALKAFSQSRYSIIAVPGYNLGPAEQQFHTLHHYDEAAECRLLANIAWQNNGYRLFDIANLSGANHKGPLQLLLECNCLFTSKKVLEDIGGADERFNLAGGGSINLHLYRKIGMHKDSIFYFLLAGEGSFHQFHGGVTTSSREDRDALLQQFRDQLNNIWGGEFGGALKREPILLGAITSHALPFVIESSKHTVNRFNKLAAKSTSFWQDDGQFDRYSNIRD